MSMSNTPYHCPIPSLFRCLLPTPIVVQFSLSLDNDRGRGLDFDRNGDWTSTGGGDWTSTGGLDIDREYG